MFDPELLQAASELGETLKARGWMLATAESCTGGLIAAACTEIPGSSQWFDRGFVTYSNAAKTELLGVPPELITKHGAVSQEVVEAMAHGAVARSTAQVSIAISGIAGPGGGSVDKPVGTVWLGLGATTVIHTQQLHITGTRAQVRIESTITAITLLKQFVINKPTLQLHHS